MQAENRAHGPSKLDTAKRRDGLSTTHAERLKTLMTLNFQQFADVSLMAV